MHLPGKYSLAFLLPPQSFFGGWRVAFAACCSFEVASKRVKAELLGKMGFLLSAMTCWDHTPSFTKGNSTPQPKSGEMSTTRQAKEKSL